MFDFSKNNLDREFRGYARGIATICSRRWDRDEFSIASVLSFPRCRFFADDAALAELSGAEGDRFNSAEPTIEHLAKEIAQDG